MRKKKRIFTGNEIITIAIKSALNKKAENIVVLNPGSTSEIADWFLICEGTNEIHNRAIANAVMHDLKEKNNIAWYKEGLEEGRWILLDYIDVIVNIILPDLRAYYELDTLWKDCPREIISD